MQDDKLHIICFYWKGDRWKESSDELSLVSLYVNNLYRGVRRFANQSFKFICFTNESIPNLDEGIETREFPLRTKCGVLPRLYMFSKDAGLFGHQVLCLDLDIVITGKLDTLMDYRGRFCTRSSFRNPNNVDGDIMSFQAGRVNEILFWNPLLYDTKWVENFTKGRERTWMQFIAGEWADRWITPGEITSYKIHGAEWDKVPEGVSVVSFHGQPRPHQVKKEWVREYWPYKTEEIGNTRQLQPFSRR